METPETTRTPVDFDPLAPRAIDQAMRCDRPALRRLAGKVREARKAGRPHDRNLRRLHDDLLASVQRREQRAASRPAVSYPEVLPISQKRQDIAELIREHQVVVVCGETGSGKSTQLPKLLLELGLGVGGMIAHTQPRRIAARTLATRVAQELAVPLGREVGYAVRFADRSGPETLVRYVTDGLLLAELNHDRDLLAYDAVIVDEAHERSLNIDFLLGYLQRLLPRRPDLKVVVTSATIDTQRFADYFAREVGGETVPAPIIEVSGRTFPVETRYRPLHDEEAEAGEVEARAAVVDGPMFDRALCEALDEVLADSDGDVLIFMPTERAIAHAAKTLRGYLQASPGLLRGRALEVLPLYARLSPAEQQKVFNPTGSSRRVVIATNVAESSVTVPNVTAVIDPGTARLSRYSPRTRMQRLPIEAVSRASADQRAGRCGRVAPGICVRLFGEQDYESRDPFTTPEVLRTSLAAVILRMAALRLGRVDEFPFPEPPKASAVREGEQTLLELGAIDHAGRLTRTGRSLAKLPIDPRVGRMVLAGADEGCLAEVLVIASALEGQDPRLRPAEHAQAADQAHAEFRHPASDFLGFVKLWDFLHTQKAALSSAKFKKDCQQRFISFVRVREWIELHRQLRDLAREAKLRSMPRRAGDEEELDKKADAIHRALLTGLLSNVAHRTTDNEYTGAHGVKLRVWPGSTLAKAKPRWVFGAETVATTQQYARTCAKVDPGWVERAAGDLVTKTHREPHWVRQGGFVAAFERASLYGLVLAPKRRIRYAKVDPAEARRIFLHEALVLEDTDLKAPFLEHNRQMREKVEQLQAKQRRSDLLADTQARFDFYDRRLPADVCGVAELNRFLKRTEADDPRRLFMSESDLLARPAERDDGRPDHLEVGGLTLPLQYKYEAGAADDGVTLQVPLHALGRLPETVIEWGVPGQLVERITALVRSLPKPVRKPLAPAPDSAAKAAARLHFGEGAFLDAVADALGHVSGQRIDPAMFDLSKVDSHQRMNVAVVDEQGKPVGQGRNLAQLQRKLADKAGRALGDLCPPEWRRDGFTSWNDALGDLPADIAFGEGEFALQAYPALVDRGESVSLRVVETQGKAQQLHAAGVLRLCEIEAAGDAKRAVRAWPELDQALLLHGPLGDPQRLDEQLAVLAVRRVFAQRAIDYPPRSPSAFAALLATGRSELPAAAEQVCRKALAVLREAHPLRLELDRLASKGPPSWGYALEQIERQVSELLPSGFLQHTPEAWLGHVPRYLAGARLRLRKLGEGKVDRDRELAEQLERRLRPLRELLPAQTPQPEREAYRWMLEEWRVSLFAQELGTSIPVSDKRLDKQWRKVTRGASLR